jgi:hypothetical protein
MPSLRLEQEAHTLELKSIEFLGSTIGSPQQMQMRGLIAATANGRCRIFTGKAILARAHGQRLSK